MGEETWPGGNGGTHVAGAQGYGGGVEYGPAGGGSGSFVRHMTVGTVGARNTEGWEAEAATHFMEACGLGVTPDAIDQLTQVFLPCLRIMTERPWDPEGNTWRESGVLGILTDCRKKFSRLWERGWKHGKRHDDSALDLINYLGFYMRSVADSGWGEWGNPATPDQD